jgi:hypothetical protein
VKLVFNGCCYGVAETFVVVSFRLDRLRTHRSHTYLCTSKNFGVGAVQWLLLKTFREIIDQTIGAISMASFCSKNLLLKRNYADVKSV